MNKRSEDFITKVLLFIKKAKKSKKNLKYISDGIKCRIDTLKFVTPRQKHELYKMFMDIVRNDGTEHGYRMLFKTMNFIERRSIAAAKVTVLQDKMDKARSEGIAPQEMGTVHGIGGHMPGVFYLCSVHTGPAADHKEWQGKIYVDRYWRSVMEGARCTADQIRGVGAYIKNHNILAIQDVVNHKPYLVTRPYCRHYFIPLSTVEVLGSSLNRILKEHPEAHTHSRSKPRSRTRRQYARMSHILD